MTRKERQKKRKKGESLAKKYWTKDYHYYDRHVHTRPTITLM